MSSLARSSFATVAVVLLLAMAAAGCGSDDSPDSDSASRTSGDEPTTVAVPLVENETARRARREIREEKLRASIRRRFDESTPRGRVIKQKPAAGEEVERGETVTLIVSRGAEPAPEPEPEPEPDPEPKPTETSTLEESTADCDPSYPDVCIPSPPPDLNCPDIDQQDFTVKGDDPHGFDVDNNGVGCE